MPIPCLQGDLSTWHHPLGLGCSSLTAPLIPLLLLGELGGWEQTVYEMPNEYFFNQNHVRRKQAHSHGLCLPAVPVSCTDLGLLLSIRALPEPQLQGDSRVTQAAPFPSPLLNDNSSSCLSFKDFSMFGQSWAKPTHLEHCVCTAAQGMLLLLPAATGPEQPAHGQASSWERLCHHIPALCHHIPALCHTRCQSPPVGCHTGLRMQLNP